MAESDAIDAVSASVIPCIFPDTIFLSYKFMYWAATGVNQRNIRCADALLRGKISGAVEGFKTALVAIFNLVRDAMLPKSATA